MNCKLQIVNCSVVQRGMSAVQVESEMEKRADAADASVLFFLLGCAIFLAVYVQIK